ncbi:MAG: alpha/beta hydrolase [Photobacterium frigidiphilum]|uniref:alpha/beta hydrolase n=1 Tax=Photobacterium frigidiphilum TaxID=264736 RepID=UPI0030025994
MSSKIYFSQNKRFNMLKYMINITTRLHHVIAPKHARHIARKILLTPVRRRQPSTLPDNMVRKVVETPEGKMMTYQLGSGPVWVLGHGWSGSASQFFTLMEHIAATGYTAIAFDNPAHGQSEGIYGHLPGFIKAFDGVLDTLEEPVAGVVAHSMGGAIILESRHQALEGKPVLLVAPVLNYAENLLGMVERSGYSTKVFHELIDEIAVEYQYPLESINPLIRLEMLQSSAIIVHDKGDKIAPFEQSQQASEMKHVQLFATEGLGHGRILKSPPLLAAFDQLSRASC